MKIAMTIPKDSGGITKYSRRMSERGLEESIEIQEFEFEKTNSSNPAYWYNLGRKASKEVDLIHLQYEDGVFGNIGGVIPGIMIVPFLIGLNKPLITTIHTIEMDIEETSLVSRVRGTIRKSFQDFAKCLLYSRSEKILSHAPQAKKILLEKDVQDSKIEYFPEGLEKKDVNSSGNAKENLGFGGEDEVIGSFGYVRPTKNIEQLIDIVNNSPRKLVVAGGVRNEVQEEYLRKLKEKVKTLNLEDSVVFTGFVDQENMPMVMGAIDLMVMPYDEITWSGVFALSVEHQIPVIASNLEYFEAYSNEYEFVETFDDKDELEEKISSFDFKKDYSSEINDYLRANTWNKFKSRYSKIHRDVFVQSYFLKDLKPTFRSKVDSFYRKIILPRIKHLRGASRISLITRKLAILSIVSKDGENYHYPKRDGKLFSKNFEFFTPVVTETDYLIRFITEVSNSEGTIVDAGAYHGFYSLLAAAVSKNNIIAFEPDDGNLESLKKNVRLNKRDNQVSLDSKALMESGGKAKFSMNNDVTSSLGDGNTEVSVTSLDSYLDSCKKNLNPSVIKMDIEGAELRALKGMSYILESQKPTIFCEVHFGDSSEPFEFEPEDLFEYVEDKGYSIEIFARRKENILIVAN